MFTKKIKKLPSKERERIEARIEEFNDELAGSDIKKLSSTGEWRLRVGRWRLIFRVSLLDCMIAFTKFGPRGDVYKK